MVLGSKREDVKMLATRSPHTINTGGVRANC